MPRRGYIAKRDVLPDPLYNSKVVTKLINNIMLDGKRGVAQRIVYDAFEIVGEKTGKNPVDAFAEAMDNIMPVLEVKARRVGGATYQVPIEVRADRRQTLGLRWLTAYSRSRNERTMAERLAAEIMDAIGINEDAVELPLDAGLRSKLRRINNAINALSDLRESDVGELSHSLSQFIGEMRAFRARKFEKLTQYTTHCLQSQEKGRIEIYGELRNRGRSPSGYGEERSRSVHRRPPSGSRL